MIHVLAGVVTFVVVFLAVFASLTIIAGPAC